MAKEKLADSAALSPAREAYDLLQHVADLEKEKADTVSRIDDAIMDTVHKAKILLDGTPEGAILKVADSPASFYRLVIDLNLNPRFEAVSIVE